MDVLKENQSNLTPYTPHRNTNTLSHNSKENIPSYKNYSVVKEKSLQNLSRDDKLQLYEFDENDPPETKKPTKKRQYKKKKRKMTKSNNSSPAISAENINDSMASGKTSTPLQFEDNFSNHESSLTSTPICGSKPLSRKRMTSVIQSPSPIVVAARNPSAQIKNIKKILNLPHKTSNRIGTLSHTEETPKKSITFRGVNNLLKSPFSCDIDIKSLKRQSFKTLETLTVSTPITSSNKLVSSKKQLLMDANDHFSAPHTDMFGFEDYLTISEEILPVPHSSNVPNLPQLTTSEIQTLLGKDTNDFNCSLNSTTLLETSTFLMDTSLIDSTPNLVDTSMEMNDTTFSVDSNVPDDILAMHSGKDSRKFYSPLRRQNKQNKRKFHDFEKLEEPLITSVMKRKKINKLNKKEEEHYDKMADVLNSTFKKIEEFQLAFE